MHRLTRPSLVLGKHGIYDLSGCDPEVVNDPDQICSIALRAAEIAQMTILGNLEHHFIPQGYSMVLLLEESHLSLHTWPEHGYVSVDLFSCSTRTDFEAVRDFLADEFRASLVDFQLLDRGPFDASFRAPLDTKAFNGHIQSKVKI